jgi:hypothetical protein
MFSLPNRCTPVGSLDANGHVSYSLDGVVASAAGELHEQTANDNGKDLETSAAGLDLALLNTIKAECSQTNHPIERAWRGETFWGTSSSGAMSSSRVDYIVVPKDLVASSSPALIDIEAAQRLKIRKDEIIDHAPLCWSINYSMPINPIA